MKTRKDLAETILGMNFSELMGVARSLSSMKDAEVRPKIETAEEYAALLSDWAEAEDD